MERQQDLLQHKSSSKSLTLLLENLNKRSYLYLHKWWGANCKMCCCKNGGTPQSPSSKPVRINPLAFALVQNTQSLFLLLQSASSISLVLSRILSLLAALRKSSQNSPPINSPPKESTTPQSPGWFDGLIPTGRAPCLTNSLWGCSRLSAGGPTPAKDPTEWGKNFRWLLPGTSKCFGMGEGIIYGASFFILPPFVKLEGIGFSLSGKSLPNPLEK
jgi:hypothetical protein